MQNVDILIIDASQLFREGLKQLLDEAAFAQVAEAETMEDGLKKLEAGMRPKVALVDFDAANDDINVLHQIRERCPELRLVVLAANTDDILNLARCFEAGADAYLLKTISSDALKQSIKLVLLGEKVFPTRLAAMLVRGAGPRPAPCSADLERLSCRENQILRCLLNGHPNKVIAKTLNITEATVKVHLKGVLKKINAVNRTQAAIWALNNGLSIDSPPAVAPPRQPRWTAP